MKRVSKMIEESRREMEREKAELKAKYPDENYPEQICPYCGKNGRAGMFNFAMNLSDVEPPHHCSRCLKSYGHDPLTDEEKIDILVKYVEVLNEKRVWPGEISPETARAFWIPDNEYYKHIFRHEFAKAFFGTELNIKRISVQPDPHIVGSHLMGTQYRKEEGKPMWMKHLERMVTEKEPLRYLKQYYDRHYRTDDKDEVNSVVERLGID